MKALMGLVAGLLVGIPLLLLVVFSPAAAAACSPTGSSVVVGEIPDNIAGYQKEQLTNGALVIGAATAMKLPPRAAVIGVMTAMGESSLRNISYGDNAVNPDGSIADSIGLFQQQSWWGTVDERMNPTITATKFFEKLQVLPGWQDLEPTIAAHRVQGNSDPRFYTEFYPAAVEVVAALSGTDLSDSSTGSCTGASGNFDPAAGVAPGPWGGFSNGRIDVAQLAPVPWNSRGTILLRADAVAALTAMNEAFKLQFGYSLPINSGYRNHDEQVIAKQVYGSNAATPGTSNHGWAMAVDIADRNAYTIGFSHPTYLWLKQYGPSYGWEHPEWAEPGGVGPDEAWHWEFYGVKK